MSKKKKDKKEKSNLKRNLKMTWALTKGARKYFFIYLIFLIALAVVGAIVPTFTAKQIVYINNSLWSKLLYVTIFVLTFELSRNVLVYFYGKFIDMFYRESLKNIQIELAKNTLKIETEEIDNNTSGLFINRLNSDTNQMARIFWDISEVSADIMSNVGILFAIFLISKIMFLYLVITIIILFIFNNLRTKYRFKMEKEFRKFNEKNTGLIGAIVRGLRDIKVLNAEDNFLKKVSNNIIESNQKKYRMTEINRRWSLVTGTVHDMIDFLFIVLGMNLILKGTLSIENMVIVYMYKNRLYNLLNYFTRVLEFIKDFNLSADRVFEIFDDDKFKKEKFGDIKLREIKGNIEFKNVEFGYSNKDMIFKDLNFKINAHEKVAFVGKSGGGKSTIFSLITKLYHPSNGKILLDGYDINGITSDSIRNNVSIITQMPYIFNFSIKDNLKIVKPNATKKEIEAACKSACLHDFIMTLPDKYDTIVGEGGVTLSGGQRQRLAIARALLTKTEIILFDEATSALDNETQKEISQAIDNLKGEYTILIVAHRLSTVIDCDRIFVVDNGKIIDVGTHQELMEKSKFYRNLYESEV